MLSFIKSNTELKRTGICLSRIFLENRFKMFMGRERSLRRHLVLHELLMVILLHLFCTQLAGKTSRLAYFIILW